MAPVSSNKKGASAKSAARDRRSVSRHSTPLTETSPPTSVHTTPVTPAPAPSTPMAKDTSYLHTSTAALVSTDASIEVLIEKSNGAATSSFKAGDPPAARDLHVLHDRIRDSVHRFTSKRGEVCDRSLRQLVQKRKERLNIEREQEAAARVEAERAKGKREEEERRKEKKSPSKKRNHDEMDVDGDDQLRKEKRESLPDVGAHGLARQDGVGVHEGAPAPPSPPVPPGTAGAPDLMDAMDSHSESGQSHTEPTPTAPLYERIFGKDPTLGDDPIIYDIRELHDDMTDDEKRAILNVFKWPESDLRHLTAGDPPDQDFSNAKPANQVNFSTFQTYIEPYIRPYTEEDVAFLKDRGNRDEVVDFATVPRRGSLSYKERWAAQEGLTGIEPPQKHQNNPNEARGSMEDLDDDIADQDTVSMGPIMSRLLSVIRPSSTGARKEETEDANGDTSMVNGDDGGGSGIGGAGGSEPLPAGAEEFKPATYLPPDAPRPANVPQADYDTLDQRAKQELKYLGILEPSESPEAGYDAHNDDEVAARLRTLQHELQRVSRLNNIRKSRVLELTEERMAMQEYSNIADDLDNQVNAAYLKRNRSLAKPNQKKGGQSRPGQKGVASVATSRGVSDGVRALMQKRRDWIEMVGPVVQHGRSHIPDDDETIFDEATLKRLDKAEREAEAVEGDAE